MPVIKKHQYDEGQILTGNVVNSTVGTVIKKLHGPTFNKKLVTNTTKE